LLKNPGNVKIKDLAAELKDIKREAAALVLDKPCPASSPCIQKNKNKPAQPFRYPHCPGFVPAPLESEKDTGLECGRDKTGKKGPEVHIPEGMIVPLKPYYPYQDTSHNACLPNDRPQYMYSPKTFATSYRGIKHNLGPVSSKRYLLHHI